MSDYRSSGQIQTVAVVGAGTIGKSWAAYFWARGLQVHVVDPAPGTGERIRDMIETSEPVFRRLGLLAPGVSVHTLPVVYDEISDRSMNVDFVQENAPENLEAKRAVLRQLDEHTAPDVVIASSTSGLTMSSLQEGARGAHRMVIGHPMNPPHLIPLVELAQGAQTDPAALEAAKAFYASIGRVPVVLRQEILGHIATRLTAALWREAAHIVATGAASAKDVDQAVVHGLGLRLSVAGPHLSYHMGGGEGGLANFFAWARGPLQAWCDDLGAPVVNDELIEKLVREVGVAYEGCSMTELTHKRDADLAAVLGALRSGAPLE